MGEKLVVRGETRDFALFTVSIMNKNAKIENYIVAGESVKDVLEYCEVELKAPILAIYPTEYKNFLDSRKKNLTNIEEGN